MPSPEHVRPGARSARPDECRFPSWADRITRRQRIMWFSSLTSFWSFRRLLAESGRRRSRSWLTVEALEDRSVPAFLGPVSYHLDSEPAALAIVDLNNDAVSDVVVSNQDNTTSVLLGKSDGTFQSAAAGPCPNVAAYGDFNGDNTVDLVTKTYNGFGVLLGNGDASFQPVRSMTLPNDQRASSIGLGDFNGDGRLDLAVGAYTGRYRYVRGFGATLFVPERYFVNLILGNGDGTFHVASTTQTNSDWIAAVADFNSDNRPDIVAGTDLLLGKGDGTLQKPTAIAKNLGAVTSVADLNRDGNLDLVTYTGATSSSPSTVR